MLDKEIEIGSRLLRLAVETSPDAMILAREDGTICFANRQAAQLFGYEPEELLALTIEDLVPSQQRKKHARHRESYLANPAVRPMGATDTDVELRGLRKDGTQFPADISLGYLETEEGLMAAAAVRDTSSRKSSEEAQVLTKYLDTILLNLPVGVAILEGPDLRYFRINKMLADLNGLAVEDHLGKPLAEVLPDSSNIVSNLQKVRTEGTSILGREFSTRLPRDPDTELHLMDFHFPISVAGQVKAVGAVVLDVTARKRAEAELQKAHDELETRVSERTAELEAANSDLRRVEQSLREQEAGLRNLVETAHVIPWKADAQSWRFIYVGPHAVEILGYPVESWYEDRFWEDHIHPDDRQPAIDYCKEASQECSDYNFEYRMLAADGREVWLHDIVNVVSENGQPRYLQGFMIDITERKRLEARLQELSDKLEAENVYLRDSDRPRHFPREIVGESETMRKVFAEAEKVAVTDSTVLVLGETGTGKELLSRWIHRLSQRRKGLMVEVNCAGLPATLVESELFGRDKGAYTGALTTQKGRFELADRSTIFLDEVAELPLELQGKLLRVLQEGRFERLGNPRPIKVDVRVIAATNRDLEAEVREGRFRMDLYYRLNVFPITMPPLRQRRGDVRLLVWAFVEELAQKMGKSVDTISRKSLEALEAYSWPGNVRELRNVIERAMILSAGGALEVDLPLPPGAGSGSGEELTFEEAQRRHIQATLERADWRVRGQGGAAEALALKPTTLETKMRKLGIQRP